MVQSGTIGRPTLAVGSGSRHHTAVRTASIVGYITVARGVTTITVILGVVVTVVTTTG